jgi:glycosyltransferase involved in cell wall biosynthesis
MREGVAVCGELARASGLGQGARLMVAALRELDVRVWEVPVADLAAPRPTHGTALPPAGVPLVLHVNAPMLAATLLRLPRGLVRGRRVVGYWAWELPVAPPGWAAGMPFVHEVWAPSRFTADALEGLAPGRVRVVPHPVAVAPPVPSGVGRADFGLPAGAFVVLTSFSLASSFARKNPLAAIAAFRAAFGDRADRVLVLKLSHTEHWPADLAVLRAAVADAANIRIEARTLPAADAHALTACADVVLSLHRSEGFGLVPAEAMLLGKPVVATDWSATAEFIDASVGVPVPYTLIPAVDPRGVFEAPGAVWAEADVAAAAAGLRGLAENAGRRAMLGQAARVAAARRFTSEPLRLALMAGGLDLTR